MLQALISTHETCGMLQALINISVALGPCESHVGCCHVMQAWLGLSYVDVPALWALFIAFGASIIQVCLLTPAACFLFC